MLSSSPPLGPCSTSQTLRVAIAPGEDFRSRTGLADEGIVRRHRAVVAQADDLAGEIAEILGALHLEAVADADIHQSGAVEDDARAEIEAALAPGQGLEDHLDVAQAALAQFGAGDRRGRAAAVARDIGEIERAILREVGVQADIEQAGLAARPDRWYRG